MELTLKIYDKTGKNVVREVKGETYEVTFGTIQELMSLLEITNDIGTAELLKKMVSAYGELTSILDAVFPEVSSAEWKTVKVRELVAVVMELLKTSFMELFTIPTDPKNVTGA